jgi:hypothetical protein
VIGTISASSLALRRQGRQFESAWGHRINRCTLWMLPTEGSAVCPHNEHSFQERIPGPGERIVPKLEIDETIPPRPEEEIADVLRATPDVADHSQQLE